MIDSKELRRIVYKITNTVNGKIYFGITKCGIDKRWGEHKHNALRNKKHSHLYLAIRKYGIEYFKIEVVASCASDNEMYEEEKRLIALFNTTDGRNGYNNSIGGEVSSAGKKLTLQQRERISTIQRGRKRNHHSEGTKEKMRIAALGRDMAKAIIASANSRRGKKSHNAKQVSRIDINGEVAHFSSFRDAATSVNGHVSAFGMLRSGRLKTYKGYKWTFEN